MGWLISLRMIAAEDILSLTGLIMLLIAAWGGDKTARALTWFGVAALAAAAWFTVPALTGGAMGQEASAFFGQYSADSFASYSKLLIDIAAAASLLVAPSFFERQGQMRAEYPLLIVFAVVGMGLMVSATNLLTLYIGLELNSLAAYVLAASSRGDNRSAEAGLKYFVLGALASGILLFGMSLTYGFAGTTSFEGIRTALHGGTISHGALFGLTFMLAGLAFKVSAVPFHMWTPDVYEGAPTPVTTFFATAPKVAALSLTMRVALFAFGEHVQVWQQIVVFVAVASIIVGALGAIGQSNIKRLLAYSSINNVGFILIGLATGTPSGAAAMLVYLAIYVAMSVGGFVAVLMLRDAEGNQIEAISDIAGLSRTQPLLAGALAMVMFSLAGIPPLFGFWGKFVVFQAAVAAGMVPIAVIAIVGSVPAAFYYLKVVKVMYFDEPAGKAAGRSDWVHIALLTLSMVAISPLGYLASGWLGGLAKAAADALFHAA